MAQILLARRVRQGGDEYDGDLRCLRVLLEHLAGGVTVLSRHEHVEENEIGIVLGGKGPGLWPAGAGQGPVSVFFEHDIEKLYVERFVIDDEDAGGGVFHCAPCRKRVLGVISRIAEIDGNAKVADAPGGMFAAEKALVPEAALYMVSSA